MGAKSTKVTWHHPKPFDLGLVAVALGGASDLYWHLTHKGFETAADQLQAHSAYWIGITLVAISAWRGLRKYVSITRRGYTVAFVGSMGYLGVSAWHFIAHSYHLEATPAHLGTIGSGVILVVGLHLVRRGAKAHSLAESQNNRQRP